MRVLLATTSTLPDRMGGGERVFWHLAQGLARHGHEVRIIVPRVSPSLPRASVAEGVTIVRYDDPAHSFATLYVPSVLLARRAIRRQLREWSPDIVHANQGLSGLGAAWAGASSLFYTFYGPWHLEFLSEISSRRDLSALKRGTRGIWAPAKAALARAYERRALWRSRRIIVLSTFSIRQLAQIHGVPPATPCLVPGGVDLTLFAPAMDRTAARRALGLPETGRLLFTVRRLVPRMGLETLLRALTRVPETRLVIAGAGWLRAQLEQTAAELGVADRVTFAGFVPDADLPTYYQAADLTVLPSATLEGFGLITLESLACGTPIVATPNSGTTDILTPFDPTWIAADTGADALARCIAAVLPRVIADAGIRARCRAHASHYSWERMVDAHEALYRA